MFVFISFFAITTSNILTSFNYNKILNTELNTEKEKETVLTEEIKAEKIEIDSAKSDLNKIFSIENSRFITHKHTSSGRTELWMEALEKFDFNNIFGYGPQADRLLLLSLSNKYGNNVSNAAIYSLVSGGYPSLISIMLLYIYTSFLILNFLIKNKIYKFSFNLTKKNKFFVSAICYTTFFMLRSLIENSFSVFSIDFLIMIFSIYIVERNYKKEF